MFVCLCTFRLRLSYNLIGFDTIRKERCELHFQNTKKQTWWNKPTVSIGINIRYTFMCLPWNAFLRIFVQLPAVSAQMKAPNYIHELGVFWANDVEKHPILATLGVFCTQFILMGGKWGHFKVRQFYLLKPSEELYHYIGFPIDLTLLSFKFINLTIQFRPVENQHALCKVNLAFWSFNLKHLVTIIRPCAIEFVSPVADLCNDEINFFFGQTFQLLYLANSSGV